MNVIHGGILLDCENPRSDQKAHDGVYTDPEMSCMVARHFQSQFSEKKQGLPSLKDNVSGGGSILMGSFQFRSYGYTYLLKNKIVLTLFLQQRLLRNQNTLKILVSGKTTELTRKESSSVPLFLHIFKETIFFNISINLMTDLSEYQGQDDFLFVGFFSLLSCKVQTPHMTSLVWVQSWVCSS